MERRGGRKYPEIWNWICSFWKLSLLVLWTKCSNIPFLHPSPIFASRSLRYISALLYNRSSVCERGTLNFPADFHDLLQFAVPPSVNLVWPFSIKVVRFSARTACKLPLSWVGQSFAMVLSDLSGKNPEIRQLGTKVKKSLSIFTSFVHFTVSHLIRGDPWSIQMLCVEWKRNHCYDMTTMTLPGLCDITICFLSSLTRSKHQQKGPSMSAWTPVKTEALAATVACQLLGSRAPKTMLIGSDTTHIHVYINLYLSEWISQVSSIRVSWTIKTSNLSKTL